MPIAPYPVGEVEAAKAVSFFVREVLQMHTATVILGDIFLMFLAAKLAGELFERLRQPAVIGELLAGMLIGPYALGLIGLPTAGMIELFHGEAGAREGLDVIYEVLAELGVVILLFVVGLETRLSDILRVGMRAGAVARSEEHTSELQSRQYLVCRLLLEKKKTILLSTYTSS